MKRSPCWPRWKVVGPVTPSGEDAKAERHLGLRGSAQSYDEQSEPPRCCLHSGRLPEGPTGCLWVTMPKIPAAEEDEAAQLRAAQEARLRSMNSLQWLAMQAEHAFEAGLDLCVPRREGEREGGRSL